MSQEQDRRESISEWLLRMRVREVRPEDLRTRVRVDNLKETLDREGFEVNVVGAVSMVHLTGYLPTGEPFSFISSEVDDAMLSVGNTGDRPFDERAWNNNWDVVWRREVDESAAYIEASEIIESDFRRLHQQYLDRAPSQFTFESRS